MDHGELCDEEPSHPGGGSLPDELEGAIGAIAAQFDVLLGQVDVVGQRCLSLERPLKRDPDLVPRCCQRLVPLLRKRTGEVAWALFDFLERWVLEVADPSALVIGLLDARDAALQLRAIELVEQLRESGRLRPTIDLAARIASRVEMRDGPLREARPLALVRRLLDALPAAAGPDSPIEQILVGGSGALRSLAARVLDAQGPPRPALTSAVVGDAAAAYLAPYFDYTDVSHADLVALTPVARQPPPALASLQRAEALIGRPLLATVVGQLGWQRVCWGVAVQPLTGLSVGGSFPLAVAPDEASLLEACGPTRRLWDRLLFVAVGSAAEAGADVTMDRRVQRFRKLNLIHAELLAAILEVAPLTAAKARRIIGQMEQVVEGFVALFSDHTDDAVALRELFDRLRRAVLERLSGDGDAAQDPETTRLVQMFEDPRTLDEVRTLHGLKRYLHQQSLRLAFRLFRAGSANRTVDLVVATPDRVLRVVDRIRYIDFEPEHGVGRSELPLAVTLVSDAFGRQLLHGSVPSLPHVEILCYGNEVQLFVHFRNHPAVVRLDLSPPVRGGMIDLEYFGVSQHELEHHPDLSLQGIQRVFRQLDFDVEQQGLRLHFRYDKERALDLDDLIDHAETLFRVMPYLMDFDWTLGSLDYPEAVRATIADAWAEFLVRWGVLPTDALLTDDRRKILETPTPDPAGARALAWNGRGAYRDRFTNTPPADLLVKLREVMQQRGLAEIPSWRETTGRPVGQLLLDRTVLLPLRRAIERGEARLRDGELEAVPATLFRRDHEAVRLAELLHAGDFGRAVRLAELVAVIETSLRFQVTGSVHGYPVERAQLRLRRASIGIFVLRDAAGIPRLALAADQGVLFHRRRSDDDEWRAGADLDADGLLPRLRQDNYLAREPLSTEPDLERLLALFERASSQQLQRPDPADRILIGISASPGRATGPACLTVPRGHPEQLRSAVLVVPVLGPQDAPLLRHAAAVVSTGGGILSHAGLIALEMGKPALVVKGRWSCNIEGHPRLLFRRPDYREVELEVGQYQVVVRRDLREQEEVLDAGDLVVVDADAGTMSVLGQDREALALLRDLQALEKVAASLARSSEGAEILVLRGGLLRAVHQLEKLLGRIDSPGLARYAVQELLLSRDPSGESGHSSAPAERGRLLRCLFANRVCRPAAQQEAQRRLRTLQAHHGTLVARALQIIPVAGNLLEVLFMRCAVLRVGDLLREVSDLLAACGLDRGSGADGGAARDDAGDIDAATIARLNQLRATVLAQLVAEPPPPAWQANHLLRAAKQIDDLLGPREVAEQRAVLEQRRAAVVRLRRTAVEALAGRSILTASDGGLELRSLAGAKAANLGEIARIAGDGHVPAWFAITDRAFQQVLDSRCAADPGPDRVGASVRAAIEAIVTRTDLHPARKAAAIRSLWQAVVLPPDLGRSVVEAYRALSDDSTEEEPFVAIRSSAFEEDTAQGAWAGQFDTFLFVRGDGPVLEHLKLAWAGLWSERALYHRDHVTSAGPAGGGVIVQRIVRSRVAGVLLTTCPARGSLHEMVINVGLGLGEGIASGLVDVDHVLVHKEGLLEGEPVRCSYKVGDKREQVVFDALGGLGTRCEETLYHQRLRPALDYVELTDLARAGARLEAAYGYPLDIEFALEGPQLCILQARPVAVFQAALRETTARHPFSSSREELR